MPVIPFGSRRGPPDGDEALASAQAVAGAATSSSAERVSREMRVIVGAGYHKARVGWQRMPRRVASYSWDALERLDRAAVRAVEGVRRMLEDPTLEALARGVGDIVGAEAQLVVRRTSGANRRPRGLLLP